ncbi:MAG: lipid-A-disaccharide synthase [Candidatus Omnitrophica bacterium]|nr:lipid-A-disaccharide synthase [Candidatus Omnitrophota bacterium]
MAQKKFMIVCGEASGEMHAAGLATALKKINPDISLYGVGGELLKNAGVQIFYDIKELGVIGLFDVLKKLPTFLALKKTILKKIQMEKPSAIIFVDFSGFNLRLAKEINNRIPAIYYVSPQVWASRRGRIQTIKKYIRKMIVIFKFEEEFYRKYGIEADFVGHPLLDIVRPSMTKEEFIRSIGVNKDKTLIAILPGSRRQEIEKILPVMLKAAVLINGERPAQFIIAKSPLLETRIYNNALKKAGNIDIKITEGKTYDCLNIADFSLIASGTATLESAIMQKPFAIIYKMGLLNYLLYRPQIKIPYIGLVNIVAGKKIVPELVQFKANPSQIAKTTLNFLNKPSELEMMKTRLAQVKSLLGQPGASSRAAQIIIDLIR